MEKKFDAWMMSDKFFIFCWVNYETFSVNNQLFLQKFIQHRGSVSEREAGDIEPVSDHIHQHYLQDCLGARKIGLQGHESAALSLSVSGG